MDKSRCTVRQLPASYMEVNGVGLVSIVHDFQNRELYYSYSQDDSFSAIPKSLGWYVQKPYIANGTRIP